MYTTILLYLSHIIYTDDVQDISDLVVRRKLLFL